MGRTVYQSIGLTLDVPYTHSYPFFWRFESGLTSVSDVFVTQFTKSGRNFLRCTSSLRQRKHKDTSPPSFKVKKSRTPYVSPSEIKESQESSSLVKVLSICKGPTRYCRVSSKTTLFRGRQSQRLNGAPVRYLCTDYIRREFLNTTSLLVDVIDPFYRKRLRL